MATRPKHGKGSLLAKIDTQVTTLGRGDILPVDFTVAVRGKTYDGPGLAALLTAGAAPLEKVVALRVALSQAVAEAVAAEADLNALSLEVDQAFRGALGLSSPLLLSLDINPKVPRRPLDMEQRLTANIKSKETRRLRGTLGPKKKAALKATAVPPTEIRVSNAGVEVVTLDATPPTTTTADESSGGLPSA